MQEPLTRSLSLKSPIHQMIPHIAQVLTHLDFISCLRI